MHELIQFEVGDEVWLDLIPGYTCGGGGLPAKHKVIEMKTKYDEDTGKPFTVVFLDKDGGVFRQDGSPFREPWAYCISPVEER